MPEAFAHVDAAWLHMEQPTNLMVISGFFELARRVELEQVREVAAARLARHDRFRQRVEGIDELAGPHWNLDPHFDLSRHVTELTIERDDDEGLRQTVDELISRPLDYAKPLWELTLIQRPKAGSVILTRIHHAVADGIALMRVLLSISDEHVDEGTPDVERDGRGRLRRLLDTGRHLVDDAAHEGLLLVRESRERARLIAEAGSFGRALAHVLLRPADPRTPFSGPLGVRKTTAWSRAFPLDRVKKLAHRHGATINDVLMSAVAGALGRYIEEHERPPRDLELGAMVPVNLRPLEQAHRLGNYFGLVMAPLPVGVEHPLDRLRATKRHMDQLKRSREPVLTFGILHGLGMLSRRLEAPFVRFFAAKCSAVMTNVPGPREELHIAGIPIRRLVFWVPQSGGLGLGISVMSYAGQVFVGVMTDASLVPDPERIVATFEEELEALEAVST